MHPRTKEDSTLLINRLLLNHKFLEKNKKDLVLDKNDPTARHCLRVIKAINYTGDELAKFKSSQTSNKLNEIRSQVERFKGKVPPAIVDMDGDFFKKNQDKIASLTKYYEELNREYQKILENKLDTLTKIRTLPGYDKEEKLWQDRIKKLDQNIEKILMAQDQLTQQLDRDLTRARGQYGAQTMELPLPKPQR